MPATYPGGAPNTFVPSTEATNNMVVDFSRNIQSFAINEYIQIVPVSKSVGLYTSMTIEEAGRIQDASANDDHWADGDDAPDNRSRNEGFEFLPYQCKRYARGFRIGELAAEQASWEILAQHARIYSQHAMTRRSQLAATLLQTAANYPTANTAAVPGGISGVTGTWDVSTTARMDIKRSIDFGLDVIRRATLGGVNLEDFRLVISPGAARKMSVSQEIIDYLKQSPDSLKVIEGKLGPASAYRLPQYINGVKVVVEDAVKVTSAKGATRATSYVFEDAKPVLICRPGGLVAAADSNTAPRFSAATCFMKEEMSVEEMYDVNNRVHKGRVVENYAMVGTAFSAAFLFTTAIA